MLPYKDARTMKALSEASDLTLSEAIRADELHKYRFHSMHEGYAVIKEELDELWEAVRNSDKANAEEEAIQVAAMCIHFLTDLERMRAN